MAIKIYKSTDTGAPTLNGLAGSLIAVLDACLINGYGSQTPPGGWTKPFSGTNKAAYRNDLTTGTGTYWRLDDSASIPTDLSKMAGLRAYRTMADVDNGTEPAPTMVQRPYGVSLVKSGTADATARPWCIVADARFVYMFLCAGTSFTGASITSAAGTFCYAMGDVRSFFTDPYGAISSGLGYDNLLSGYAKSPSAAQDATCTYLVRPRSLVVGAVSSYSAPLLKLSGTYPGNGTALTAWSTTSGMEFVTEWLVLDNDNLPRGRWPGLRAWCNNPIAAVAFGDTVTIGGVPHMAVPIYLGNQPSWLLLATTGDWYG